MLLTLIVSFPSQSDFFLIYPNVTVVLTQMYSIAFCAAAPKCMLRVKFDLRQEFAQRQNPKSRNPQRGTVGWLSQFPDFNIDGCGEPLARLRYPMCKLSPCILISRRSICRRLRRRRRRSLRRGEFAITV